MKCNTFILKCFLQFTYTNLDGSQKEGVTFKICFRKRGALSEKGGSNPGGNYGLFLSKDWVLRCKMQVEVWRRRNLHVGQVHGGALIGFRG